MKCRITWGGPSSAGQLELVCHAHVPSWHAGCSHSCVVLGYAAGRASRLEYAALILKLSHWLVGGIHRMSTGASHASPQFAVVLALTPGQAAPYALNRLVSCITSLPCTPCGSGLALKAALGAQALVPCGGAVRWGGGSGIVGARGVAPSCSAHAIHSVNPPLSAQSQPKQVQPRPTLPWQPPSLSHSNSSQPAGGQPRKRPRAGEQLGQWAQQAQQPGSKRQLHSVHQEARSDAEVKEAVALLQGRDSAWDAEAVQHVLRAVEAVALGNKPGMCPAMPRRCRGHLVLIDDAVPQL